MRASEPVFKPTYPHSLAFRLHDLVVRLDSNDPRFLGAASRVFYDVPESAQAPGTPEPAVHYRAWIDRRLNTERKHALFRVGLEEAVIVTTFYPALMPALERDLVNSLTRRCPDIVLLGAACLASGDSGVLLIGEDRNQQSRLARDLVRAGLRYYADRYTLLRRSDGRALPFRKGITIERLRHPLLTRVRRYMPFRGVTMNTVTYTHPGAEAAALALEPVAIRHVLALQPSSDESARITSEPARDFGLLVSNADCGERMDSASFDVLHRLATSVSFHTLATGLGRSTTRAILDILTARENSERT
jgi:hypothetical protein